MDNRILNITKGTALVRINRTLFAFFDPDPSKASPYYFRPDYLFWCEFFDDCGRRFFAAGGFKDAEALKLLCDRVAKKRLEWIPREGTEVVCEASFKTDGKIEGFIRHGKPLIGIV